MVEKYRDKVIIRYDLLQFRNDRFSKDVVIVQSDFDLDERILQALILSQYKQEVAAKHRINLKPVILFKAQRTIAQSQENKANFHRIIEGSDGTAQIARIRQSDIPLVRRAFRFFDENGITDEQLVERLKQGFHEDFCLSVNDEKEKENYQILVNTLEDKQQPHPRHLCRAEAQRRLGRAEPVRHRALLRSPRHRQSKNRQTTTIRSAIDWARRALLSRSTLPELE